MNMDHIKTVVRTRTESILNRLYRDEKSFSDRLITKNLLSLPEYKEAKCVFAFYGVDWELNTVPFIEDALAQGKKVALPLCFGKGVMEARQITSVDELTQGRYKGIPEPASDTPLVEKSEIDFALVPCVCADRNRFRLGHGGGYYDRYLAERGFFAVTVTRNAVLMDAVPRDEYDERCDCVITETEIIR